MKDVLTGFEQDLHSGFQDCASLDFEFLQVRYMLKNLSGTLQYQVQIDASGDIIDIEHLEVGGWVVCYVCRSVCF
jgi:hypothetical protein